MSGSCARRFFPRQSWTPGGRVRLDYELSGQILHVLGGEIDGHARRRLSRAGPLLSRPRNVCAARSTVPPENAIGLRNFELVNGDRYASWIVLDLILITVNSLLTALRGQAAIQVEIIALRHQLTVLQRTQKPK